MANLPPAVPKKIISYGSILTQLRELLVIFKDL